MTLTEFFDIQNPKHLRAYICLHETGIWAQWFLEQLKENNIVFDEGWYIRITGKMALNWAKSVACIMELIIEK